MKTKRIAKACHAAHNQICKEFGQPVIPWESKSPEHHETVKNSVKKILNGVIRSPEEAHMNFVFKKREDGWKHGTEYSTKNKTNPRLCDFDQLPKVERLKEEMFFAVASSFKN